MRGSARTGHQSNYGGLTMPVNLVSFQITDSGGSTRSVVLPCADTETLTDIQSFVTNNASVLDDTIAGIISGASVNMALTLPGGLNATPADDKLVDLGGLLGFDVADSDYRTSIYHPTTLSNLIDNSKNIQNAGAMATWITALLAGTYVDITDKHENSLVSFLSGKRVHRK